MGTIPQTTVTPMYYLLGLIGDIMKQKVLKLARHRNGVCGEPFKVAIVDDPECGKMLVIRFEDNDKSGTLCAALSLDELKNDNITPMFRGNWFAGLIDKSRKKLEGTY